MGCFESKPAERPKRTAATPKSSYRPPQPQPQPEPRKAAASSPAVTQPPRASPLAPGGGPTGHVSQKYGLAASKRGMVIAGGCCKRLEKEHDVNVVLPKKGDAADYIHIEGDAAAVEVAHAALQAELGIDLPKGDVWVYSLDVPRHRFGAIIGKGGATLKDIEKQSRAALDVPQRADTAGHVTLKGSNAACALGVKKIEAILKHSVAVAKTAGADGGVTTVEALTADLSKPITRALFFPSHEEPEGCTTIDVFLSYLRAARTTLDICIFNVTHDLIADTVMNAHRRGVAVRVICDNDQMKCTGSDIEKFVRAGIPCRPDAKAEHMHNKFAVLDGKVLLNGSFNWTVQATERNDENVSILSDRGLVGSYSKYFAELWGKAGVGAL
eukprot:TRINITY_DN32191_c0_g1_i1.p1 TRINITY_DN32191_c0_g1~~TRINITY_DN32191_c0_g1_i1.p1  ORF type:complete len:384 (+),score=142.37 TRINITY_DN32191_c0_g1_i1:55-1206(+)